MSVSFSEALAAYRRAAEQAGVNAPGQDGQTARAEGPDFAQILREAAENGAATLRNAETQSLAAAAGKADLNEVVMAMSQAEMTLQTVVTLRDRAVQAYQEILRMPI